MELTGKKVFVVNGGWDYEGYDICAIVETLLEAEEIQKKLEDKDKKRRPFYDYTEIKELTIGEVYKHP